MTALVSLRHPAWEKRGLGYQLRAWQGDAVAEVTARLGPEDARICLVAPPGAGKTICSLAIAEKLGCEVIVFVPTTALEHQWRERVADALVALVPDAPPPPISIHTYASKVPMPEGALVILDEAHHTTQAWGRHIEASLTPGNRVLGLTATPPYDALGWEQFVSLVGGEPVTINAPPLVREGQLCPYQDLAWPMAVDLDDLPALRELDERLHSLEEAVEPAFGAWATNRLRQDLWTLTEERFSGESGLLVALCRLRSASGGELPTDLPMDPELYDPPTLHDRSLALWAFGTDNDPSVLSRLREVGFRIRKKGPVLIDDVAWRSLATSAVRIRGTIEVLAAEHAARGDSMRALIVCDRDAEGERLSARQVLKALVDDPRTDVLDPILCTGTVFWVDDDLWPRMQHRLPPLPWVEAEGHRELDVQGWETAERVAMVTKLLTEGVTRCLVGTRHLLGEGWDCPPVSCVVDLTGITASVTVNQVRGRAMRPDPADASKVASLWDVFAVAPGIADGDRMLRRFQARHQHTFGVDAAGRIRSGVARIDPVLAGDARTVMIQADALKTRMRERVNDTISVASRWAVGKDYRNARVWRVAGLGAAQDTDRATLPPEIAPEPEHEAGGKCALLVRQREFRSLGIKLLLLRASGWTVGLTGAGLTSGAAVVLAGPIGLASLAISLPALGICGLLGHLAARAWQRSFRHSITHEQGIFRALHAALVALDDTIGSLQSADGHWWVEGETAATRRFAEASAFLFGPILHPRYLLIEGDGTVWPLPEELGARRDLAEAFAGHWSEHVGPCSVMYARSEEGRKLLQAAWKLGAGARKRVEVVEDWE
jgi:superfamily II DNA or RNA helicase